MAKYQESVSTYLEATQLVQLSKMPFHHENTDINCKTDESIGQFNSCIRVS